MNGLLFGGLFWGILISLIGLTIVLKYAFHIDIPLIRIFLGIIIILFGLKLIIGNVSKSHNESPNDKKSYHYAKETNILFSSGTVDLTSITDGSKLPKEINVVFGSAVIQIPDSLNLEITSTTVFGTTVLPGRSYAGFGEDKYVIRNNSENSFYQIQTNTVFGKLEFETVHVSNIKKNEESDSTNSTF